MNQQYAKLYALAKDFASIVHHGQKYGTNPYEYHLVMVDETLRTFGFGDVEPHLLVAAWLHDVIEDTPISYEMIKHGFGGEVADIVYAVTNEAGKNRKERNTKTYPKIRASHDGLVVKLADRIANIEFSKSTNSGLLDMYKREWQDFRAALFDPDESDCRVLEMWECLRVMLDDRQE